MLSSVIAYDYYENQWTYLPDMIERRSLHSSVSLSNKLFVIGGENSITSEVFDSVNRKFSYIKNETFPRLLKYNWKVGACCVGDKIIVVFVTYAGEYQFVVYDSNNK